MSRKANGPTKYTLYGAGSATLNVNSKQAQQVGEELERLSKSLRGHLTPRDVLDAAKAKQSPLHDIFEWDDSTAAERFRIFQARNLIRLIRIDIELPNPRTKVIEVYNFPAHASLPTKDGGRAYVSQSKFKTNDDMIAILANETLEQLSRLTKRLDAFKALSKAAPHLRRAMTVLDKIVKGKRKAS